MRPSNRLDRIPPYLFAELERKIAAKREQGVDVISLGIGDPDIPTAPAIVEALATAAEARLQLLGYGNIGVRIGDGSRGWAEHAPFDKILVTAAVERTPSALLEQLKPGGRIVLPVGPAEAQRLTVVSKDANGAVESRVLIPVRFSQLETAI